MKRPAQCDCRCPPPISFEWGRSYKIVGPQTAIYDLSSYNEPWDAIATPNSFANTQWGFVDHHTTQYSTETFRMQPMRYEIGKPDATLNNNATLKVGTFQRNVAVSDKSPPLDGHLDSTTVTSVEIPLVVFRSRQDGINTVTGYWHAVELFRNGVSLGVRILGTGYEMNTVYSSVVSGVSGPYRFDLDTPLTVVETDVWAWDVYVNVVSRQYPGVSLLASNGSGIYSDVYAMFSSTTTLFGEAAAGGMKFVFGSNGPGGITELTIATQAGWTRSTLTNGSTQMRNTAGTIIISLKWDQEIPRVRYTDTSKTNSPAPYTGSMDYRPADSGDYLSLYVNNTTNITFGKFSPASATVFDAMFRVYGYAPAPYAYCIPSDSLGTGFPSSITVEPA